MSDAKLSTGSDPALEGRGFRVLWVDWDSAFRDAGLRVGDALVGDHGERYTPEEVERQEAIAGARESARLERFGTERGDTVSLLVERRGELLTLEGELLGHQTYRDEEGQRILGPGGPVEHEKDGFDYAWRAWYQKFVDLARTVLAGWDYTVGYDTRRLRERVAEFEKRVAALGERYPSAFAARVREDFDRMLETLAGEPRELGQEQLAWRDLGEIRARKVAAACDEAWEAFLASFGDELNRDPFPAPKALEEKFDHLVGKVVLLPPARGRDVVVETANSWYKLGRSQGIYVVNRRTPELMRLYQATDSYIEMVNPYLDRRQVTFVGSIQPAPVLVSSRGTTFAAIVVLPSGALVEDPDDENARFFVDLRPPTSGSQGEDEPEAKFAGQDSLLSANRPRLEDEQGPAEVLRVLFDSLKHADFDTWQSCFADWKVRSWFSGSESHLYVDLSWQVMGRSDGPAVWDRSRKALVEEVWELEVAALGEPRVVFDASRQTATRVEDGPRTVEEVRALVDHVGRFDDGYRTFAGAQLHRKWELQRLDDGPWRVISGQPI